MYEWRGRPALMIPTLAYCVEKPNGSWVRCSATRVEAEGELLDERQFWSRFRDWNLQQLPVQFSMLGRPDVERPRAVQQRQEGPPANDSRSDED
jgi:hypothetical protein